MTTACNRVFEAFLDIGFQLPGAGGKGPGFRG